VARILVTDPDALARTDIADHALSALCDRGVEEVLVIGRRGPLQAPFTTLELRELGDLAGLADVEVIVEATPRSAGVSVSSRCRTWRGRSSGWRCLGRATGPRVH
jgi:NADPH-dependent glutamate synthase beta subunit-like oxidoreductase